SIALRRGGTRERVATEKRNASRLLKTQDQVLAGQSHWQRSTVRALHRQREDIRALLMESRYGQRPKPGWSRMRTRRRREPRVATRRASRPTLQQRSERRAPPGRKRLERECAFQPVGRMIGRIKERVDLCDGHPLVRRGGLDDFVASAHLA